jgi:hypothetical protein
MAPVTLSKVERILFKSILGKQVHDNEQVLSSLIHLHTILYKLNA